MKSIINLNNISFSYISSGMEIPVIKQLSLEILPGEIVSLTGPEQCGKSTILSLISGILTPTKGQMTCNNIHIGYMTQNKSTFQWHDIYRNFSKSYNNLPLIQENDYIRMSSQKCESTICNNILCKKKASLIKSLINEVDLLLLDEPFSSFNLQSKKELYMDIINIIHQNEKSALFITSNICEALSVSDRVFVLSEIPCFIIKEFNTKTNAF